MVTEGGGGGRRNWKKVAQIYKLVSGAGESGGGEMETTVLEQQ